jgi:hypothetical protein
MATTRTEHRTYPVTCGVCGREIITMPCPFCYPVISEHELKRYDSGPRDICVPADADNESLNMHFLLVDIVELWKQELISNPLFHGIARRAMDILLREVEY